MKTGWQKAWVRILTTLLTAAVMVMIFCFSTENAEQSDQRSGVFSQIIIRTVHPDYDLLDAAQQKRIYDDTQMVVRKCAHFSEYALLGFLIRLCMESWFGHRTLKRHLPAIAGFVSGSLYAVTDELHQLAIDGRYGKWTDVLIDSAGVLTGVILGTLLICMSVRKQKAERDAGWQ